MKPIIQFIQITPEELTEMINNSLKTQLEELKLHFTPKQPNEYLTRQQVATMLGVDLSTLYNWNKKKILCPVGIAGRVYYIRSEIEASLKPLNI